MHVYMTILVRENFCVLSALFLVRPLLDSHIQKYIHKRPGKGFRPTDEHTSADREKTLKQMLPGFNI